MTHKLKRRLTDMYKDDYSNEDDCAYYTEIYLKTEADAVIAELEEQIEEWKVTDKCRENLIVALTEREKRLVEVAKRMRHTAKCNIHAACYGPIEPCNCGLQDLRTILNEQEGKK